jgi:hypothetical protein
MSLITSDTKDRSGAKMNWNIYKIKLIQNHGFIKILHFEFSRTSIGNKN